MTRWPLPSRLDDPVADRAAREQREQTKAIADQPALELRFLGQVELPDGVAVPIAHGLGRPAAGAWPSAVRGATSAGRIVEVFVAGYDPTLYVVLKASGYGATITSNIAVL